MVSAIDRAPYTRLMVRGGAFSLHGWRRLAFHRDAGIQSDGRGSRGSGARQSNAGDHRRSGNRPHVVSCPPPLARQLEPIGEARARSSDFTRPAGDRRGSTMGGTPTFAEGTVKGEGCAESGCETSWGLCSRSASRSRLHPRSASAAWSHPSRRRSRDDARAR